MPAPASTPNDYELAADDVLAEVERVLANAETDSASTGIDVLARPERDLRIETWVKRAKNGNTRRYWQWCERTGSTGKRGGKRWRAYGGTLDTLPADQLSGRQRAKWSGRTGNLGKRVMESEGSLGAGPGGDDSGSVSTGITE